MRPAGGRTPAAGGFTLVEIAVALAGAGLLAGALMTVIIGQARFQERNDDATLAQQNVRGLVDIVGAEIRGASPGDIMRAEPDSLALRLDLLRAVVCDAPAPSTLDVFVYDSVSTANVPRVFRGTAVAGPYDGAFAYADGFAPVATPAPAAEMACRAHGADPGGAAARSAFRRITSWTAPIPAPSARGSLMRVYGWLKYALAPSSTDPGALVLRRNGQELATPLAPGARFEYELSDGSVHTRVGTASLSDIRVVRVHAHAAGRGAAAGRPISFDVPLRG